MKLILLKTTTFLLFLIISCTLSAQDVSNVDVKTLPQKDIEKALKAAKDAGLSEQEAFNLARQKGATEQQIRDFQNRVKGQDTIGQINDVPFDENINKGVQSDNERMRERAFNTDSRIFGSYLFNSKNLSFEPSANIQTPKNYEISIGDQIIISVWGNSQNNYQLTVNLSGQIIIPDVGPIYIAGLTFDKATEKIKQRLTDIYADMGGSNPETFAQINMGQLRSIQINLLGEVTTPGTYILPGTATVFNALYLSGGPNKIGSFRTIKIIRDNKTLKTVDIYKFLIDADPSENITLKNNDVIFIPPAEKKVAIGGQFKRNGIFELKEDEMLNKLIGFAGGFTADAYLSNIQILRKTQRGQKIIDVTSDQINSTLLFTGDSISCNTTITEFENRVTISGSVYRPGEYEFTPGLTLYDLIVKADSISPDAFRNRGILFRENLDLSKSAISFNVGEIVNGETNILLQKEDSVQIKSHFELKEQPFITVNGEVLNPGEFNWAANLTLGDAIFLAGGLTEGADSTFIEIARRLSYEEASDLTDQLVHTQTLNLARNLDLESNDASFILQPFDQISVRQAPGFRKEKTVYITGEVKYAGAYAISTKKQRISDLLKMAGGVTPQAFINGATLQRTTDELGFEKVAIDLSKIINTPGNESDLFLNNGDRINIPEFMQTVKITGSVQNPFSIVFETGKNAKHYIHQSGGFNKDADKRRTYVQFANGSTAVTKGFIVKRYPEVQPGSQIVVPQKPKKENNGQWMAIVGVLTSLALTAATIVSLTK